MQLNYNGVSPVKNNGDGKIKEKGPSIFGVEFKDIPKTYVSSIKQTFIDKPIDYLKRISPYEIQIKKKIDDKPQYKKGKM